MDALTTLVNSTTDTNKLRKWLRLEVAFQKMLHPNDAMARHHLYRMNFLTAEQLAENLAILLDDTTCAKEDDRVMFPCEDEIYDALTRVTDQTRIQAAGVVTHTANNQTVITTDMTIEEPTAIIWKDDSETTKLHHFTPQQPITVIWDEDDGTRYWSVGFFIETVDDNIKVDHLERKDGSDIIWLRPKSDDIQIVKPIQIIPCLIDGYWNFSTRPCTYNIKNVAEIKAAFSDFL